MSTHTKAVVLTCDWRGCKGTYWLTSSPTPPTIKYARDKATDQGWECLEVFDLCPEHTGKRPIQR